MPLPPVTVTVPEYALPIVAVVAAVLVIDIAGSPTVIVRLVFPVPCGVPLSCTDSATVDVPTAVGVPLMVSVAPLPAAFSPAGRPVGAAQV